MTAHLADIDFTLGVVALLLAMIFFVLCMHVGKHWHDGDRR